MSDLVLETDRLRLRPWRDEDLAPFAALNADPRVMRHFPATLDRGQSDAFAASIRQRFAEQGWGFFALERQSHPGEFIGFVGLNRPGFEAPFQPAVEIGWRLSPACWGRGYATEAAGACLDFAFDSLALEDVVSFTVPANTPSRRVMERLGMQHDREGDFGHPALPADHPLHRHVLYRLSRKRWSRTEAH